MKVLRWIFSIPIGIALFKSFLWINYHFLIFAERLLPFIPMFLWRLEYLFVNSFICIYIAIGVTYLLLPKDKYAVINNKKIKLIQWCLRIWTCYELLFCGVWVYDLFNNYRSGMIFDALYPPFAMFSMWLTFAAIKNVDYRHNLVDNLHYSESMAAAAIEI